MPGRNDDALQHSQRPAGHERCSVPAPSPKVFDNFRTWHPKQQPSLALFFVSSCETIPTSTRPLDLRLYSHVYIDRYKCFRLSSNGSRREPIFSRCEFATFSMFCIPFLTYSSHLHPSNKPSPAASVFSSLTFPQAALPPNPAACLQFNAHTVGTTPSSARIVQYGTGHGRECSTAETILIVEAPASGRPTFAAFTTKTNSTSKPRGGGSTTRLVSVRLPRRVLEPLSCSHRPRPGNVSGLNCNADRRIPVGWRLCSRGTR